MSRLVIRNHILEDLTIDLPVGLTLVGRAGECGVRLSDSSVSRFHARLERLPNGELTVEDLGSSNGTFLGDERLVGPHPLRTGAHLRFGSVEATIEAGRPALEPREHRSLPWILAAACVLVLAAALALFWDDLQAVDPGSDRGPAVEQAGADAIPPPGVPGPTPEPGAVGPGPIPDLPAVGPDPVPRPVPHPPPDSLLLENGRRYEGQVIEETTDVIVFRPRDTSQPTPIPKEQVVERNGAPYEPDLDAIFAVRFANIEDAVNLMRLTDWCATYGLEEARGVVARRLLEVDPASTLARDILGWKRYLGQDLEPEALAALGVLGADGELVGTPADALRLRRVWLLHLDRPPLPPEAAADLALPAEAVPRSLFGTTGFWRAWFLNEALDLVGPDGLAELEDLADAQAEALAGAEIDFRDALLALLLSPAFAAEHPGSRAPAAVLEGLLEVPPEKDARLTADALAMWSGKRVAVFGDRGSGPEDLIRIVMRQPRFYQRALRRAVQRILGRDPGLDAINSRVFDLVADPAAYARNLEAWMREALAADAGTRSPSDIQLVNALYVDALGRVPTVEERVEALRILTGLGDRDLARAILASLLTREAPPSAPVGAQAALWIGATYRRVLARLPTPAELEAASAILASGDDGARSVLRTLLADPGHGTL